MLTYRALPFGCSLAGTATLILLTSASVWAQASDPQSGTAQVTDQQAVAPLNPIVAEVRRRLASPAKGNVDKGDYAALAPYYAALNGQPLWVDAGGGFTPRARNALAEIGRADDWGLSQADFDLPRLADTESSPAALADAEIKLGFAVLQYARYARGGRLDPRRSAPTTM